MAFSTATDLRLAIISTPRSGNTWLRHLLATVFAAEQLAVHTADEVPWDALPRTCVLQLHVGRTRAIEDLLARHGFRVVVLARHPLDVLISILHFATHDGATAKWLSGAGGDERTIHGAMPGSAAFVDYACGQRASALLSVSTQWWQAPGALTLTYEDLVADTAEQLQRIVTSVGAPARVAPAEAIFVGSMENMRREHRGRHHFWQGKPGHWRHLLVAEVAETVAAAQAGALSCFGYICDPDRKLSRSQADALWIDLTRAELTEKLWHYLATRHELEKAQNLLAEARTNLERFSAVAARLQERCATADDTLAAMALEQPELFRVRQLLAEAGADAAAAQRDGQALAARLAVPWNSRLVRLGRRLFRGVRSWAQKTSAQVRHAAKRW